MTEIFLLSIIKWPICWRHKKKVFFLCVCAIGEKWCVTLRIVCIIVRNDVFTNDANEAKESYFSLCTAVIINCIGMKMNSPAMRGLKTHKEHKI